MNDSLDGSWPAPAKINRFLHITGRRADGYHLLQTLFQFLDFGDSIEIELRLDSRIVLANPLPGVPEDKDLTVRAALALQAFTGCKLGADIRVIKRLPMGGGLGGGSSDAATVLIALNQLWKLNLSAAQLADRGLRLGADVPIFVHGHAAWAEGVGEQLSAANPDEPWVLVVKPPVEVPTARIFADPQLTRNSPAITIRALVSGEAANVCEPVVRRLYPEVGEVLDWLARFAETRMTGTGSCVFSIFETRERAREVQAQLPQAWWSFVAKTCNRSPLLDRAATA